MPTRSGYLLFLSFLEGGAVMACELIGAKMLAPYFGTSLYVWAAALGLTLGGLMSGYYLGGALSRHSKDNRRALYLILIAAGAFLFLMPYTSDWIMSHTIGLELRWGAVLSLLVFMFPPLVFMGMVSPMIINLLTQEAAAAGRSAGTVYAISTLGGILVTFLLGFYIIPEFGITRPAVIGGLLLAFFPALSLIRNGHIPGAALWGLLLAAAVIQSPREARSRGYEVLYYSEGVLGQVKVIRLPVEENGGRTGLGLVVNNTLQTVIDPLDPGYDYWPYTAAITHLAASYPPGSRCLVLGMGGGTLVRRLEDLGYDMDIVELDRRIRDLAVAYFGLDSARAVVIDDARHFVRTAPRSYDLIVYDVFRGETAPEHVLTLESMQETAALLRPGGLVLINFYGYLEGSLGQVSRSVLKTLGAAGLETRIYTTPGLPDQRNLVVAAWPDQAPCPLDHPPVRPAPLPGKAPLILPSPVLSDAFILTDHRPQLQLFARAAMQWRKLYNRYLLDAQAGEIR